jgi:hypothetical protein
MTMASTGRILFAPELLQPLPSPSDFHLQCFVHLTIQYAAADEYWCLLQDYFEFDGGSSKAAQARGIKPETQAAIQRWLEDNQ